MAGFRKAGPQCSHNNPIDVVDGTTCRAHSSRPGPLGINPGRYTDGPADFVAATDARALQLAPAVLSWETGYNFGEPLEGLIADLLQTLKALASNRAVGWKQEILTSLGLDFLPGLIGSSLAEAIWVFQMSTSRVNDQSDQELERAAEELALAAGIFARAILEGIVKYLENGSRAPKRESITSEQAVGAREIALPTNAALAPLLAHLRSCKLERGFAMWVERNWKELLKNPRLRTRPRTSEGSITSKTGRASPNRTAKVSVAPLSQSVSDTATFSSDVSLGGQAAMLVAAGAQGAPFCPV
jgi:hypothetical protein